jgi:transposase
MDERKFTMKDHKVIAVVEQCYQGKINRKEALELLGCCRMTLYRKLKRYRESGAEGLIHRSRFRPSNRRIKDEVRIKIIELKKSKYYDFNDVHYTEFLNEKEGIKVSRETVRKVLRKAGIPAKNKVRGRRYRKMRERRHCYGELVQIDASIDYWLSGVNEKQTIIAGIDDATGKIWAVMVEKEGLDGYFMLMREIIRTAGIPQAIYSDRHSIFFTEREATIEEQLRGKVPMTQFGRAMYDLGVRMHKAFSPQAKGRIERLFKTLQDRFIAELRLRGINTIEGANRYLKKFINEYNRRFSVRPIEERNLFKRPDGLDLDRILCKKEERKVKNDNTISYEGQIIQIPKEGNNISYAGKIVEVNEQIDGKIKVYYKEKLLCQTKKEVISNYTEMVL